MAHTDLRIEIFDADGGRIAVVRRPRRLQTQASFGAMSARCRIALEQPLPAALDYGYRVEVRLDGVPVFRGVVSDQRTASVRPPFVVHARRTPARDLDHPISGTYIDTTCDAILADALAQLPPGTLTYASEAPSNVPIDRLSLLRSPLPYVVDLLAKLAGNRLWDIDWSGHLRWRPNAAPPDHVVYFDARRHVLRLWETDETVRNSFQFHGGGDVSGGEFRREFEDAGSIARFGRRRDRLFARAISTQSTYERLKAAVLAQLPHETNQRFVDDTGGWPQVQPGDTFALRRTGLAPLDEDGVYRARTVEHDWRNGRLATRVHLAWGHESSSRYARYIDHDTVPAEYLLGRFRLDASALDGFAHLDP